MHLLIQYKQLYMCMMCVLFSLCSPVMSVPIIVSYPGVMYPAEAIGQVMIKD